MGRVVDRATGGVSVEDENDIPVLTVDASGNVFTKSGQVAGSLPSTATSITYAPAPSGGDDTAAIKAIIPVSSGIVRLLAGSYHITQIPVPAGVTIEGAGRGVTTVWMRGSSAAFASTGGARTAVGSLSSDAAAFATTLSVTATTGIGAGDYVLLSSTAAWPGTDKGATYGEIVRVKTVTSNSLTLYSPIDDPYLTSDSAVIERLSMVSGITLASMTIAWANPGTTAMFSGAVLLQYTLGATVRDVALEGIDGPGVTVATSVDFDIDVHCKDLTDDSANNRFGYGINATEASRDGQVRVFMRGGRHAFTTNSNGQGSNTSLGVPRHITVRGIATGTTNAAWDTHFEGAWITFDSVEAHQCSAWGMQVRGQDVKVISPVFENVVGAGIYIRENASRFDIVAPKIRNVKGGTIAGVTYLGNGIYYNAGAPSGRVVVPNISFTDDDSIFIDASLNNTASQEITLPDCDSPGQSGSNSNCLRITSPSPPSGIHWVFRPTFSNATNGLNAGSSVICQMPFALMNSVTTRVTGGIDTTLAEAISQFKAVTTDPAQNALVLKAAPLQTADIFQCLDSSNGNKFRVGPTGNFDTQGFARAALALIGGKNTPAYSASITPTAAAGNWFTITATNGSAFTVNAPSSPPDSSHSQSLVIEVLNSSGGALGAITWDVAFVFAGLSWANPASTKKRFVRFEWNGSNWIATTVAGADY